MKIVIEKRAASVLYNFLYFNGNRKPYLLPANVCPIVPFTFFKAGQSFELIDIDPNTLCIDEDVVLTRLSSGSYSGVLFARTYGIERSFEAFFAKIKTISSDLIIIDDRCPCIPIYTDMESSADLILYSTGYAKIADIGFGGFGICKPEINYAQQRLPFALGHLDRLEADCKTAISKRNPYYYENSDWLDTSPLEISNIEYFDMVSNQLVKSLEHKREINRLYCEGIPLDMQLAPEYQWWRFNIIVPERDVLIEKIFANGLFASTHYPSLAGIVVPGSCSHAENLHQGVINLFNDFRISVENVIKLIAIVKEHNC